MKQHLTHAGKLILERLLFNLVSLIMLPVFMPIIDWRADEVTKVGIGSIMFSLMVCSVYLGITADRVWKIGKHDRKTYATEKYYPLKGLVIGLLSEVPFFIHFLFAAIFPSVVRLRTTYRIFSIATYMGLVPANHVTAGYALVLLIVPLLSGLFYYIGYNQKYKESEERLSHKIMYKKK